MPRSTYHVSTPCLEAGAMDASSPWALPVGRLQCTTPYGCSHMGQGLHTNLFQPVLAPPYLESSRRQILIAWQSHPRRLHGSPHVQDQHPEQLCSCLTDQVSHLQLKNKPPTLQQTFVKPHKLWPVLSRPQWSRGLWQEREMPASSIPLAPLSPFNTSDHSTPRSILVLSNLRVIFPPPQRSKISAAMQYALPWHRPSKPHHKEQVTAPLTSPQRT